MQYLIFSLAHLKFYTAHKKRTRESVFTSITLAFKHFQGDDQTNKIELQLENLRLSSVEREFRKRIAEYNTGNGMNGNGDSGSVRALNFIFIY